MGEYQGSDLLVGLYGIDAVGVRDGGELAARDGDVYRRKGLSGLGIGNLAVDGMFQSWSLGGRRDGCCKD